MKSLLYFYKLQRYICRNENVTFVYVTLVRKGRHVSSKFCYNALLPGGQNGTQQTRRGGSHE
jgi:hypothetical protein